SAEKPAAGAEKVWVFVREPTAHSLTLTRDGSDRVRFSRVPGRAPTARGRRRPPGNTHRHSGSNTNTAVQANRTSSPAAGSPTRSRGQSQPPDRENRRHGTHGGSQSHGRSGDFQNRRET